MGRITKPAEGEDVRLLHRNVRQLVQGVNALTNMTAKWEGEVRGIGRLNMRSGGSELLIRVSDPGELGRARITPPITLIANLNPAEFGATVIFSVALPSDAYGTVQFYIDGGVFAQVNLVNGAAISPGTSSLAGGMDHVIEAVYSGDAKYMPTTAVLIETINALNAPSVEPFGYPNPANKDDDLILATYVRPVSPIPPAPIITGSVRFTISGQAYSEEVALIDLGGNTWGAQTQPIDWLNPGVYEIEARYLGDNNYPQTSGFYQQIVRALVDVTMWIDPNPVHTNNTTTLHAIVTGSYGVATGTIQFYNENGNIGGPVTLIGGQAQLQITSGATERTYTFIASYSGDGNYAGADSEPSILYVSNVPTRVHISPWPYVTMFYQFYQSGCNRSNHSYLTFYEDTFSYNGPIGLQFVGGDFVRITSGYVSGGTTIYIGGINVYIAGVVMVGNVLELFMSNGVCSLEWNWGTPLGAAPCNDPLWHVMDGGYPQFRFFNWTSGATIAVINPAGGPDLDTFFEQLALGWPG